MKQLSSELKTVLLKEGASLVGFADLRSLPPEARQPLDYAVSIGVALNPDAVSKLSTTGLSREYSDEKVRVNGAISYLTGFGTALLKAQGYEAVPELTYVAPNVDQKTISAPLQHKTTATRAGLGWIGKSAQLVTEEFGSAIRFSTVLTDAPLDCGTPIEVSRCGDCQECVKACPAGAIKGQRWDVSLSRRDLIGGRDALLSTADCIRHMYGINATMGIAAPYGRVCDHCVAACPRTRRYVSAARPPRLREGTDERDVHQPGER